MNIPQVISTTDSADDVYANSAETGIVQGADLEDIEEDTSVGLDTNAGGLTHTDVGGSTLSDNTTGNNSMGTSTIGGGFGVGSSNSNATLP